MTRSLFAKLLLSVKRVELRWLTQSNGSCVRYRAPLMLSAGIKRPIRTRLSGEHKDTPVWCKTQSTQGQVLYLLTCFVLGMQTSFFPQRVAAADEKQRRCKLHCAFQVLNLYENLSLTRKHKRHQITLQSLNVERFTCVWKVIWSCIW